MAVRGKQLRSDFVLGRLVRGSHKALSLPSRRDSHCARSLSQGTGCWVYDWLGAWPGHGHSAVMVGVARCVKAQEWRWAWAGLLTSAAGA